MTNEHPSTSSRSGPARRPVGECPVLRLPDERGDARRAGHPESATMSSEGAHDTVALSGVVGHAGRPPRTRRPPVHLPLGRLAADRVVQRLHHRRSRRAHGAGPRCSLHDDDPRGRRKAMFEGKPSFWANKTVPSAVRDLVNEPAGLRGARPCYVWTALAQTGESDWEMVNSWPNRIGWSVYNRYGVVMCYDPVKLFTEIGHLRPPRDGHHERRPQHRPRAARLQPMEVVGHAQLQPRAQVRLLHQRLRGADQAQHRATSRATRSPPTWWSETRTQPRSTPRRATSTSTVEAVRPCTLWGDADSTPACASRWSRANKYSSSSQVRRASG